MVAVIATISLWNRKWPASRAQPGAEASPAAQSKPDCRPSGEEWTIEINLAVATALL